MALDDPLNARHSIARMARAREVSAGLWARAGRIPEPASLLQRGVRRAVGPVRTAHRGLQITCPTVIVHGAQDRIIPIDSSRILHQ
jgi:pimeloyl-ACP methyl ester carboxylesterase